MKIYNTKHKPTFFEFFSDDCASGVGDVVCGVLLGVGGSDDGHEVKSVSWVDLRQMKHISQYSASQNSSSTINVVRCAPTWLITQPYKCCVAYDRKIDNSVTNTANVSEVKESRCKKHKT